MTKCVPEIVGIRQKGESQNGGNKKAKHAKFFEKRTFLRIRTCAYQEERNVSFSENLTCLASLLPQIESLEKHSLFTRSAFVKSAVHLV